MSVEVIVQAHLLARQANAKKTLTFISTHDEDLDVFYAALGQDEDDIDPNHDNNKLECMEKTKKTQLMMTTIQNKMVTRT